jgi:hypothetical protein
MKNLYIILVILLVNISVYAQEVRNLRVAQTGNRVNVLYDLAGKGKALKISLYYTTDDGQTWQGPLKNISGDINNINVPSSDNRIVWDALSEKGEITGELQFKVAAQFVASVIEPIVKPDKTRPWINDPIFRKHQTAKGLWITTAIISAGVGGYSYIQSNKNYDSYKTATNDASALREKVKTTDTVYPIAFGMAGLSTLFAIIQGSKQSKARKDFSIAPVSILDGGGISIAFTF